jgi:hypothetical protein
VDWSALQEVCAAVWLAYAGRSVTDKIVAVILPVPAFVAAGFDALFNCRLAIGATRNRLGMQQATDWYPGYTCHEQAYEARLCYGALRFVGRGHGIFGFCVLRRPFL